MRGGLHTEGAKKIYEFWDAKGKTAGCLACLAPGQKHHSAACKRRQAEYAQDVQTESKQKKLYYKEQSINKKHEVKNKVENHNKKYEAKNHDKKNKEENNPKEKYEKQNENKTMMSSKQRRPTWERHRRRRSSSTTAAQVARTMHQVPQNRGEEQCEPRRHQVNHRLQRHRTRREQTTKA